MPGAHSYTIHLNLQIYTTPWPRINGLCRKKAKSQPAHGPPLQARVVAANRTVLATVVTIPAHMVMNKGRGNQNRTGAGEHGQWAWHGKGGTAGKQSRQNRAAAGKHSRRTIRPAQAL